MLGVGVIEGFYGPQWSWERRHHFCRSIKGNGGAFYIYAPKADPYFRKQWNHSHPSEIWQELKGLSAHCQQQKVAFGVGLSPYEIYSNWNLQTQQQLRRKIDQIHELDLQYLGLFFDDMVGKPDLADRQLEIIDFVQNITDVRVLFCPTYYSDDPILDKVFAQRPAGYLEKIANLPPEVEIFWTGNKVIPTSISSSELQDVAKVLKRKPLLWDNYFANDGPKQCKFLKLKPFSGRPMGVLEESAGWALNLMNQAALSEIVFASAVEVLREGADPQISFDRQMLDIAGTKLELFVQQHGVCLLEEGLDQTSEQTRNEILQSLGQNIASEEIREWLSGKYTVGSECLTD